MPAAWNSLLEQLGRLDHERIGRGAELEADRALLGLVLLHELLGLVEVVGRVVGLRVPLRVGGEHAVGAAATASVVGDRVERRLVDGVGHGLAHPEVVHRRLGGVDQHRVRVERAGRHHHLQLAVLGRRS